MDVELRMDVVFTDYVNFYRNIWLKKLAIKSDQLKCVAEWEIPSDFLL